ncbi:MAG: DUF6808 domain-containing protein [Rikenellaceae bacterium]
MTRYIIGALIAIAIFSTGYYFGENRESTIVESIKFDTITIYVPTPLEITPKINDAGEQVTIPDMLPIVEVIDNEIIEVIRIVDTLWVEVPISTYSFSGDKWRAEVSGYGVQMESMELYNKTTTHIKPPDWELSAVATIDPYTKWIGGSATRRWGRFKTSLDMGYNFKDSSPYVRAQGGVTLFSR